MILYHGSNTEIRQIDFDKCRPFKDFGKGFYLTPEIRHAQALAQARVARLGGMATVNSFDFNYEAALLDSSLKIKIFDKPNREWVEFVMKNRNAKNTSECHDFDIVIGPVADDRVAASIALFENDYISIDDLIDRLKYRELSTQYFFHSTTSLKYLRKV